MKEKLEKLRADALSEISSAEALDSLNDLRVKLLGKKGELTALLKSMKDVPPEERPAFGQLVNDARASIEEKLEEAKKKLSDRLLEERIKDEKIDVTLPSKRQKTLFESINSTLKICVIKN